MGHLLPTITVWIPITSRPQWVCKRLIISQVGRIRICIITVISNCSAIHIPWIAVIICKVIPIVIAIYIQAVILVAAAIGSNIIIILVAAVIVITIILVDIIAIVITIIIVTAIIVIILAAVIVVVIVVGVQVDIIVDNLFVFGFVIAFYLFDAAWLQVNNLAIVIF